MAFLCGMTLSAQVHHWPLTENLNDVVGDLHGTNNGVTFENDAVRGPVAYFEGTSAYANLPSFANGMTEITIACWFRMDESRVWARIYSFGEGDQTEPGKLANSEDRQVPSQNRVQALEQPHEHVRRHAYRGDHDQTGDEVPPESLQECSHPSGSWTRQGG